MSRAAVEPDFRRTEDGQFASNLGKNMIKNAILIYLAQWAGSLAVLSFAALTAFLSGTGDHTSVIEHVRLVNDRFRDVSVAVAEGYAAMPCGVMGIHYVNDKLLRTGAIEIAHPQAVVYEPTPDGKMMLIAVEYITSKGPASLEGRSFNLTGAPNRYGSDPFYGLHVWAWKANPRGAFADMNPNVTCEHAAAVRRSAS